MSDQKQAYPLCWPDGWPRTKRELRHVSRFGVYSMEKVGNALMYEVVRVGGKRQILSTNVQIRRDGLPFSNQKQPDDTGAAVYFELRGKRVSLACDKWNRVEDNVWAIAKHIEALRGQERWGVGSVEQAFRGYMALPGIGETSGSKWWETLGLPINASAEQVKEAFRILAKKHHPDAGGDAEYFRRITSAYSEFERQQQPK